MIACVAPGHYDCKCDRCGLYDKINKAVNREHARRLLIERGWHDGENGEEMICPDCVALAAMGIAI